MSRLSPFVASAWARAGPTDVPPADPGPRTVRDGTPRDAALHLEEARRDIFAFTTFHEEENTGNASSGMTILTPRET